MKREIHRRSRITFHASRFTPPTSGWQRSANLRILNRTMSTPSTNLHAPQSRRATTFRQGALKIAAIYLAFAALWIACSDYVLARINDKSRMLYVERVEDAAFALCTGILLYVLVMRFVKGS